MAPLLLNADMGESFGPWRMGWDEALMAVVDLANVACGFHASDQDHMRKTVRLAAEHGVTVGAHPGYPDLVGFGRRSLRCSADEVQNLVLYQVGALAAFCRAEGVALQYVKPHGALYNDMMHRPEVLEAVLDAVRSFDPQLRLMVMATGDNRRVQQLAGAYGVDIWLEAFADRAYDSKGYLVSRSEPGSVHSGEERILEQASRIARGEPVSAFDGSSVTLDADVLCVHGDNPESIAAVRRIRRILNGGVNRGVQ
ncbi:hypothetical protein CK501_09025 [Halovibrio salipaludis]|uniref:5-oxoprolinase subunit A n=1 Tax=Halovibrio salipaludis TaxID=2032626 RepID=A0A2A2F757_9GAMM|nr:5-oxoprolinase subunit PxpA [Halovibrio salipaludis]PAU80564.1 hypothetical protein CK501_09025 [Halovibrio salipaludis]